jgi:ribosome-binding protein aMBF1 (putative translation factor)
MKTSKLKTHRQVVAEHMKDPAYRAERERTQFAHDVAMKVLGYRVDHGLSQRALAEQLGMKQPAIARLEAGDVTPSIDTLLRLSRGLGIDFHLEVTAAGVELSA